MFSGMVHVVLIPNISEYCAAGLAPHLWWTEEEYKDFKQDALEELRTFMDHKEMSSTKDALKIIYTQPSSPDQTDGDITETRKLKRSPSPSSSLASIHVENKVTQASSEEGDISNGTHNDNASLSREHIDVSSARSALQRFLASGLTYRRVLEKPFTPSSRVAGDQIHPLALICT